MRLLSRLESHSQKRVGVIIVIAAILLIVIFAFVAFTVDVGYMNIVKSELQNAADSSALAGAYDLPNGQSAAITAAQTIASENDAAGNPVSLDSSDVEFGVFDFTLKSFSTGGSYANAVRVTTRVNDQKFFFAPVLGTDDFDMSASAIGMLNPRDIVFVVDTSGSMNDDTEPIWATDTITDIYGPAGYPDIGTDLMSDIYADFNFGSFPGTIQYLGLPLGVNSDGYAYAEMTKDDGPLCDAAIEAQYRILNTDSEVIRKQKAYRWIIDKQIAVVMPNALPTPNSTTNYGYWEKYIDYIIEQKGVGYTAPDPPGDDDDDDDDDPVDPPPVDPPPTPPAGSYSIPDGFTADDYEALQHLDTGIDYTEIDPNQPSKFAGNRTLELESMSGELLLAQASPTDPGLPRQGSTEYRYLPPDRDWDYIGNFNNPNVYTYTSADPNLPWAWMNKIGYFTYVQFMMDWGRDRSPDAENHENAAPGIGTKTPASYASMNCPLHDELTAGGTFEFPPREQPMHATRRAIIASLDVVATQNAGLSVGAGDRVAIVTFDGLSSYHSAQVVQSLTGDYTAAMQSCTTLQAVSDMGATTAIEAGIITARNHLKDPADGGSGRPFASKVIVLLTDGGPNEWQSSNGAINGYINSNPNADYYGSAYPWYNAALTQAAKASLDDVKIYNVGVGLGADYDFMDRMARFSGTDEAGQSPRGSGNPAIYEQRMIDIFTLIIKAPGSRLVD